VEEFAAHRLDRRSLLRSAAIAASIPLVAGCGAAAAVLKNPATQTWLATLAATLGANIVTDLAKEGPDEATKAWLTGFWELYAHWFPDRGDNGCAYTSECYRADATPAFLLIALVAAATPDAAACENAQSDPLNDPCGVVINEGKDGILLPAWAWQTLVTFANDQTGSKRDAELEQTKALLSVTLAPTSSKVQSDQSWARAVEYVSYMTHVGPVDLAKVERPDHSFTGMIKVSGFPDKVGAATVWEYALPTTNAN